MFPIRVKKSLNENGEDDRSKTARVLMRNGIIGLIILAIFMTPYVINFEVNVEKDSPAGNLDEFLDVKGANTNVAASGSSTDTLLNTSPSQQQQQQLRGVQGDNGSRSGSEGGGTGADMNTGSSSPGGGGAGAVRSSTGSLSPSQIGGSESTQGAAEEEATGGKASFSDGQNEDTGKKGADGKAGKSLSKKEKKVPDGVVTTILGTKIEQKLGKQNPGKTCVVFYAEDPDVVENVISTRICPDERDRHIEFHMKGIFNSHPHASGEELVRVRYVQTGPSVWTTFFQQHNDQHATLVVAPGITTDIKYISNGKEDFFHQEFDSVRVLHTNNPVGKTKGLQVTFPACVQFYEHVNVGDKSKGFMVCQENRKTKNSLFPLDKLSKLGVNPQNSDTNGISLVVTGAEAQVWAYFGKNFDGDKVQIGKTSTVDLTQTKRIRENGEEGAKELTWNKKIKSFKVKFSNEE